MPLNTLQLAKELESLYDELSQYEDVKLAKEIYTKKMAALLTKFVKTGTVIVQSGILVTTFNSSGSTTSTGTGIIT